MRTLKTYSATLCTDRIDLLSRLPVAEYLIGVAGPFLLGKKFSAHKGRMPSAPRLFGSNALCHLPQWVSYLTAWLSLTVLLLCSTSVLAATWTATGNLQKTHSSHSATMLSDGKVLIVGGNSNNFGFLTPELYDPATNTWGAGGGAVATGRSDHTATLLLSGKVLVVGGSEGSSSLASTELYDRITNTWLPAGALSRTRSWHTATRLSNGKVLVAGGGYWDGATGAEIPTAELYDPATNSWSAAGTLSTPRYSPTATLLANGKVLIVGGSSNTVGTVGSSELYDPASNTWSVVGSLTTPRWAHTATLLSNGKVLVAGGAGFSSNRSVEIFDPASYTWASAAPMADARNMHTATLLSNGTVLVAGGVMNGVSGTSAELYDPNTNSWASAGALNTSRYSHTATLLSNGKVLIAGGCCGSGGSNVYLASAELYDPNGIPTVPSAPTNPIAVAGRASATVTFNAPLSNGGSGITGYTVISSPSGGTDINAGSTALSHSITGLINGTSYTFTVVAVNVAGASAASSSSNSTTPASPPGAPTNVTAIAGNSQVTVTFTAPNNNGGSPITSYRVWPIPTGGFDITMNTTLTHTVTNLSNGTSYKFIVTATNAVGTGSASEASNSVTPVASQTIGTISFSPTTLAMGGATTVSATGSSGLPVTYSSTTPSICTVSGSTVTGVAAGTCTVAANQAGNASYNPAAQVTQNITVSKASQTTGTIGFTPAALTVGGTATASATASSGLAVTFSSMTSSVCTVSGNTVTGVAVGTCTIAANQAGNDTYATAPQVTQNITVTAANTTRLINLSTRGQVQTGNNVMIGGFIIGGSTPKKVLVRAVGPNLTQYGVSGVLADPSLQLFSGQTVIAANDDWGSASNKAEIEASTLAPAHAKESAILTTLNPGAYTAIVSGNGGGSGVGIVEVYELDHPEIPLINISTRGQVQTGDNVMIGGFIIQGNAPQTVLIRAVGPNLLNFGVTGVLANPRLQLFSGQTQVAENNDWGSATNKTAIEATGLAPASALESAILITLQPGAYTAIVSGANGGTGVGIIEVFAQ